MELHGSFTRLLDYRRGRRQSSSDKLFAVVAARPAYLLIAVDTLGHATEFRLEVAKGHVLITHVARNVWHLPHGRRRSGLVLSIPASEEHQYRSNMLTVGHTMMVVGQELDTCLLKMNDGGCQKVAFV